MVQSSARGVTSSGANAGGTAVAGQSAATGEAGRLALDPEEDQNNQQRKIDFMAQQATGGTAMVTGEGAEVGENPAEGLSVGSRSTRVARGEWSGGAGDAPCRRRARA